MTDIGTIALPAGSVWRPACRALREHFNLLDTPQRDFPIEIGPRTVDAARHSGVESVGVDLIYGLPLQSAANFARTLASVIEPAPDRISLYSYAHLPQRFKTQRQINVLDLPRAETKLQLLQLTIDTLGGAGYECIGMDHFARRDDSLVEVTATSTATLGAGKVRAGPAPPGLPDPEFPCQRRTRRRSGGSARTT